MTELCIILFFFPFFISLSLYGRPEAVTHNAPPGTFPGLAVAREKYTSHQRVSELL